MTYIHGFVSDIAADASPAPSVAALLQWPVPVPESWPTPVFVIGRETTFGAMVHATSPRRDFNTVFAWRMEVGWPIRFLQGEGRGVYNPAANTAELDSSSGVFVPPVVEKHAPWLRYFPTRPLFPGFAVVVVFWIAVGWGVRRTWWGSRRWYRHRAQRCFGCGYNIAGLAGVCPECGAAVKAVRA